MIALVVLPRETMSWDAFVANTLEQVIDFIARRNTPVSQPFDFIARRNTPVSQP